MRILFLAALVAFIVPFIASAQQRGSTSVCLKDVPPGVLLNICEHEYGMAPTSQPRLYLRVYKDGRGEYEENKTWNLLTKKAFRAKGEDVREVERLGATEGIQKALERYPVYNFGDDSSTETTIDIFGETGRKRIILTNFFAADRENKKHYPASLISLMEKIEEIWYSANGIVRASPRITFCTLMADREYLIGKRVQIYADIELENEEDCYLHDPECDRPEMRSMRTNERIGFGYDEKKLGKGPVIREIMQQKKFEPYITRVRVIVEGSLREETDQTPHNYPYRFIIERFLSVGEIVIPYVGELKNGWIYSDTFDHVKGSELKLSAPLERIFHHAQAIEWTNADKFPALRRSGRKYMTFRVVSKQTQQMTRWRWNDVYTCEIIKITEN
jgi:hypothetical protein